MPEAGHPPIIQEVLPDYDRLQSFFHGQVGCQHEAQDLTQETFTRVLSWQPKAQVTQPRSLLFRIARNLLIDRSRSHARTQQVQVPLTQERLAETASTIAPPDQHFAAREQLRKVQTAVAALPERCREVFILNRFGGLSYPEIADRLGIAPSTVEKHMIRALAACRATMDDGPQA
ncbi:sigma-70 family RNA polymerase sigma factor [Verrucomicrobium sp. BvORR106]|uniref:RNA polymerase sigma factor n=1 Tax=Verrucomicrobium sp. BvORR106 TaxID=1403819 RepID=UPI00068FF026|nr:sigma-70 family RNA polymerase sigma factor [Verrucomicrobium sp. BvORR106]